MKHKLSSTQITVIEVMVNGTGCYIRPSEYYYGQEVRDESEETLKYFRKPTLYKLRELGIVIPNEGQVFGKRGLILNPKMDFSFLKKTD